MTDHKQEPPPPKMAPVQGYSAGIPWSIHLEAYDAYSKRWAPQPAMIDLEGKNCRGGFSVGELDQFVPGWRERASEIAQLRSQLSAANAEQAALKKAQAPAAVADTGGGADAEKKTC